SEPGVGSTFWFEVALARKQAEPAPLDRSRGGLEGFRVLIIDENATNRRILREHFQSWGCRVGDESSSTEALRQLRTAARDQLPGLILLDERLAKIDGDSLAEIIRNVPTLSEIPRILIRSLGRKEDEVADASLFQATLTKPVRRSQLLNTVIDLVDQDSGESTPRRSSSTNGARSARIGLRVLVADDHEVNRKVALWMLGQLGCQAKAVANGREAIETLESQPFDIVLMDVQMPLMDGLEATQEIRNRETLGDRPRIPILALTAHAMEGDRQRCLAAGMDGYVSKPVTQRELYEILMDWSSRIRDEAACSRVLVPLEEGSAWRHEDLLQSCGDNEEIVRDVVETFLVTTPGFLGRMQQAFRERDLRTVAQEAHGLRGNSLCIGANALAATSVEIEERCRRIDGAGVEESIAVAQSAWEELREVLARLSQPKVP
ncbi:response regulator, partial [Singulisphaera rosea]